MVIKTIKAEVLLPTNELRDDLPFYTKVLGMRLDTIYPADDPTVASLSGHGLQIRIDKSAKVAPGTLRILTDNIEEFSDGQTQLIAPNGTVIEIVSLKPTFDLPDTKHEFAVGRLRDGAPWVIGRAGMHYRDLIPSRLGGSIIASHIRIPDGGPVADMVHYHTVGFQLIFCYKGWVDVLYEDQGEIIRLNEGDCLTQPPEIRHRVCHASPEIEVIEIGVPAEHVTTIDHELELPNGIGNPLREWQGQKFVHHVKSNAEWVPFRIPGFICHDTGISDGTKGLAGIQIAKFDKGSPPKCKHGSDIQFTFVTAGTMTLIADGQEPKYVEPGDAFVVPPGLITQYSECSADLELLEATLRGDSKTIIID